MTDELLPCPFCGGDAKLLEDDADNKDGRVSYKPACTKHTTSCVGAFTNLWYCTPEDAIAAWNARATEPVTELQKRGEGGVATLQPISSMPEDTSVLVKLTNYRGRGFRVASMSMVDGCMEIYLNGTDTEIDPDWLEGWMHLPHWQPLPPPPDGDKGEGE